MTLHFLSPLPPKLTGTADYLVQLLGHLEAGGPRDEDLVLWDLAPSAATRSHGIPATIDIRCYSQLTEDVIGSDDTLLIFLAGNMYHDWTWQALTRSWRGKVVSVIHDLSAFHLIRALPGSEGAQLTRQQVTEALRAEFGLDADTMADHFPDLPETSRFFVMGQGLTLAHSDAIVVHSYYARRRLQTERVAGIACPPIFVAQHPPPQMVAAEGEAPHDGVFRVGSVGFYNEIKRNELLIEAFAAFRQQLPAEERALTRLLFVGAVNPTRRLQADQLIKRHGLSDAVEFTGYVDELELQRRQRSLALQANLRFPSCGETSGTLTRAIAMGVPTVVNDFAAFAEEPATWRISVDPVEEFGELLDVLRQAYRNWRTAAPLPPPLGASAKPDFRDILTELSAARRLRI